MTGHASCIALLALLLLLGSALQEAQAARPLARRRLHHARHQAHRPSLMQRVLLSIRPKKDSRDTNGAAYSSWEGQNPGGPGDAVTEFWAEASSTSSYNGNYYNDGTVNVGAGDMYKGGWSGAITKSSPDGPPVVASVATNFESEFSSSRGVHAVSGTYEGARAVAGSNSFFNAAKGGTIVAQIEAYGPTPGDSVMVGDFKRRSVAFTNIPPNSASQAGIGNGPAAIATGYEVAAGSRAARDKPVPTTLNSREEGAGPWKTFGTKAKKLRRAASRRRLLAVTRE